jgi:hypothetical protein
MKRKLKDYAVQNISFERSVLEGVKRLANEKNIRISDFVNEVVKYVLLNSTITRPYDNAIMIKVNAGDIIIKIPRKTLKKKNTRDLV